jgi:hypothetical protein
MLLGKNLDRWRLHRLSPTLGLIRLGNHAQNVELGMRQQSR